jgi:hypothetical protein
LQLQALIFGCPKMHLMCLHWLLIFQEMIGSLNMLRLAYLKQQVL